MATDLFGVRALDVDLARREVRLQVLTVHYDVESRTYLAPPERDPGFVLGLLWASGRREHPIGAAIDADRILDRNWLIEHARWFVEHVERIAVDNDPPSESAWDRLQDFHYERVHGWPDEDALVQAEFSVRVADRAWIEHLEPGDAWSSAMYPVHADSPAPEELPHLPNVHDPIVRWPFSDDSATAVAFSDDSRFLAVARSGAELVVYDCADWTEHFRVAFETGFSWRMSWVPGQHVVAFTSQRHGSEQVAYDVDAGARIDVALEAGRARSRTGRYRVDFESRSPRRVFLVEGDGREQVTGADGLVVESLAFAADESRLYLGEKGPNVHVIDVASRTVVDTAADGLREVRALAPSPDGAYLASAGFPPSDPWEIGGGELCIRRLADGAVVIRHRPGAHFRDVAWSPDGRWLALGLSRGPNNGGDVQVMPVGMPAEAPDSLTTRGS
ncbi:hypothetical protein SAMN02982929_00426 [Saccharopolyspora kobensis]|uniref:WD40 repeat protein n=1 Tax=Saccharopolyspora kobensis TaxID=146035 RepID=A0A1H5U5Y6_9PSEU|nr:WD40 repeat domain-containing protein [Saccharopolyspora kobensis]SEF70444.1 hypothetical protein SAMN02982929_00426 [Saccharopolyspora kobensis]SFC76928.1 hypothetical protein SAMN05216506_1011644 [Saccharopolyspora kobensis]